nr:PREDICTED: protein ripply2 [Struthio camelus australis]
MEKVQGTISLQLFFGRAKADALLVAKLKQARYDAEAYSALDWSPSPGGLAAASRKLAQYTHPVRLFWPKSRCYDYLYQEAEALLKNFPVQATISFYEDSDSEEDDDDELEQDSRTDSDC